MPKNGVTVNHDLKGLAIGQVYLDYKGKHVPHDLEVLRIECEIYEVDGVLSVHTACPKCHHAQWIDGKNKKIEYNKAAGTLRVEKFSCPWEMGMERQEFGFSLCRLSLAYEGNVVRDA